MSRSLKKGPYVSESLLKKIQEMNAKGEKRVLKTWAQLPSPGMAGHTLAVHDGRKHVPIYIIRRWSDMLGEFAPTRTFKVTVVALNGRPVK